MKIAMLSSIAWRTPPMHYGPWESVVSNITEGLVERGHDVTLFATGNSKTCGILRAVCEKGYEEDSSVNPKVWECLHISEVFEHACDFDLIHNNFDFLPLSYSNLITTPLLTTIHGFSSPEILPVYKKYNKNNFYVSISDTDRSPDLDYIKTIHHGINLKQFDFNSKPDDYLLFFGRIHPDKGADIAIEIAKRCQKKLLLAGIIQDIQYYRKKVEPHLDQDNVIFLGSLNPIERNRVLGNAQALLHPINFNEPFGLSVIESMACGTPVIAFNKGSMPELIEHGKNGFLVDNLLQAMESVSHLKEIDRFACRLHVKNNFTTDHMVEKYIEVYQTILNTPRKVVSQ